MKILFEQHKAFLALLLLALLLRIAYLIIALNIGKEAAFTQPDTESYLRPARLFLETGGFVYADGIPETRRTPGLPIFLAVMIALFGAKYYLGAAILQIVFNLLAITSLYALTLKLTNRPKTALIVAFLAAFALNDIVYANALMSDSLAQSHMAFMLYFYGRFMLAIERRFEWMAFVAGSLALLAMIFLRPAFLYLPFALLLGFALFLWAKKQPRGILPAAGVIVLIAILPTTLWTLRNEALGGVRQFSTMSSYYLNDSVSVIYAKTHGIHFYEAQPIVSGGHGEDLQPYLAIMPKPDAYRKRAIEMIKSDPLTYAKAYLARIPCLFFYPEINDALRFAPVFSTLIAEFKAAFIAQSLAPINHPGLSVAYLAAASLNTLALVVLFVLAACGLLVPGGVMRGSSVLRSACSVMLPCLHACQWAMVPIRASGWESVCRSFFSPRWALPICMPVLWRAGGNSHSYR